MAQKEQRRYIEYSNLVIDYSEGDVRIYDTVKNLANMYPLHRNANLIAFCKAGSIRINTNAQELLVKANDLFFLSPNASIASFYPSSDFECKVICVSDHIVHSLLHEHMDVWRKTVYANGLFAIGINEGIMKELSFYYKLISLKLKNNDASKPNEIMHALMRALLVEFCHLLNNCESEVITDLKMPQGKIFFNRFLNMLSGNEVKRRPINYYAEKLAITPKYLTMLCLKYSDKTASDWIIQYTTEDIRFYLKNSNLSIKEISAKLGFANMSHFGSYVRKHLGASPSDFRHER